MYYSYSEYLPPRFQLTSIWVKLRLKHVYEHKNMYFFFFMYYIRIPSVYLSHSSPLAAEQEILSQERDLIWVGNVLGAFPT